MQQAESSKETVRRGWENVKGTILVGWEIEDMCFVVMKYLVKLSREGT